MREAFRRVYGTQVRPVAVTATARPESLDLDFAELCTVVQTQLVELGLSVRVSEE